MSSVKSVNLEKQFTNNAGELFKYLDSLSVPASGRTHSTNTIRLDKSDKNDPSKIKSNSFVKVESLVFKNAKDKNNVTTSVFILYQDQLAPCLNAINNMRTIKAMSIADIFRERMIKSKNLLTDTKTQHYLQLLQCYLKMADYVPMVEKQKVMAEMASQVINYLTHYTVDVDSCAVGLIPNDDLLNKLARDYDFLKLESSKQSSKQQESLGETSIDDIATFLSTTISTTREQLLINIINWSALADNAQIAKAVRRYGSILRGVDKLKKGDLVIVRFNDYHNSLKSMKKNLIGFKYNTATMGNGSTSSENLTSHSGGNNSSGGGHSHQVGNSTQINPNNQNQSHNTITSSNNSALSAGHLYSSGVSSFNGPSSIHSSNVSNTSNRDMRNLSSPPINHSSNLKSLITIQEYLEKKTYKPKAQFARYTGERGDYSLNLYFSAEESEMVTVGIEDILPLNKTTTDALHDLKMIEKLIYQPTEAFFTQVLEESKLQTINYLLSLGVDVNILHNSSFTLFDLERLKSMHSILQHLYTAPDHHFYKELEREMNERIESHVNNIDQRFLFMPRYEATMSDLKTCQHIALAKSKVKQFLGDCELVLDQLKIEKRNLMNGTTKEEMTEWWLKRIDTRVNDFLTERGYNFQAVPENYIEQPPANIKDVISNLILIQKILDPKEHVIEIIEVQDEEQDKSLSDEGNPNQNSNSEVEENVNNQSCNNSSNSLLQQSQVVEFEGAKQQQQQQQQQQQSIVKSSTVESNMNDGDSTTQNSSNTERRPLTLSNKFLNSPLPLIKELKEEIYPVIDQFIKKAYIVLGEYFDIGLQEFTVEKAAAVFEKTKQSMTGSDPQIIMWIEDMLSDLNYLKEMKRLEDAKNEKVLHIVPIGGLVMNTFARMENELNTVVELWDDDNSDLEDDNIQSTTHNQSNNSSNSSNSTGTSFDETSSVLQVKVAVSQKKHRRSLNDEKSLLHLSVANEQIEKVEKILETDADTINQVDVNGWTPLHSAAHCGNAEICKILLQVEGVDVTIKNRDGASILHYFSRHPLTERRKEVILLMLKKGVDINNGTRHGETPLHSAAFKGLNDVVLVLLQSGANPNALTQGGETPLHYAVTTGRANVVNTLLLNGAKLNICSKRGTPLDLARHAKLQHIISILENGPEIDNFSWRKNNKSQVHQIHIYNNNLQLEQQQQQLKYQLQQQQYLQSQLQSSSASSADPSNANIIPSGDSGSSPSSPQQKIILKRVSKIEIGSRRSVPMNLNNTPPPTPTSNSNSNNNNNNNHTNSNSQ